MKTSGSVGVVGVALLLTGWWLSTSWVAAVAGVVGLLGLLAVLIRRRWHAPPSLVGVAVIAQVAVPRQPNWTLVVLAGVLLAVFLALSEIHESRLDSASWSVATGPHRVPVGAGVVTVLLAAGVHVAITRGPAADIALAIGAAACVALLLLTVD